VNSAAVSEEFESRRTYNGDKESRVRSERCKWGRKESGLRSKAKGLGGCKRMKTYVHMVKSGFPFFFRHGEGFKVTAFDGDVTKSREDS
jgi:hypothetical protein